MGSQANLNVRARYVVSRASPSSHSALSSAATARHPSSSFSSSSSSSPSVDVDSAPAAATAATEAVSTTTSAVTKMAAAAAAAGLLVVGFGVDVSSFTLSSTAFQSGLGSQFSSTTADFSLSDTIAAVGVTYSPSRNRNHQHHHYHNFAASFDQPTARNSRGSNDNANGGDDSGVITHSSPSSSSVYIVSSPPHFTHRNTAKADGAIYSTSLSSFISRALDGLVVSFNSLVFAPLSLSFGYLPSPFSASIVQFATATLSAPPTPITRPIRIGFAGGLIASNPIQDVLYAAIDGALVAVYEANNVDGGIAGRTIEISVTNTNDVSADLPAMIDDLMSNESTVLDALAIVPGRNHINRAIESAEKHGLCLFAPVGGDRVDFEKFNPNVALFSPIPDVEIEALLRDLILARNVRRIAIVTTHGEVYGNELIPLIDRLLGESGLSLSHHLMIKIAGRAWPEAATKGADAVLAAIRNGPVSEQPQAVIYAAAFYEESIYFAASVFATLPNAIIATPGFTYLMTYMALSRFPAGMFSSIEIITTQYTPLSTDTSYSAIRQLRKYYPIAHASATDNTTAYPVTMRQSLAYYDYATIYSSFMTSGYIIMRSMINTFRRIGYNGITAQSILDATFSSSIFSADDMVFGPFSAPCTPGDQRTVMCECNSGARQVLMSRMNANRQLEPLPSGLITFSVDSCNPSVSIQSPLIQLIAAPSTVTTGTAADTLLTVNAEQRAMAAAAAADFTAGDTAGYVNETTSPSSRTGIKLQYAYSSVEDLVTKERDSLLTIATGSVYPSRIDANTSEHITTVLDPLYAIPPLDTGFVERVVHLGPTLQQEIHALASVYSSASSSSSSSVSIGAVTTVSGDSLASFVAGLGSALEKSTNTFGSGYEGLVVSGVQSIAAALDGGAIAGGIHLLHGIATAADITAIDDYLGRHPAAKVLIPSHHVILWYSTFISTITEMERRSRVIFATNLPNWNPSAATTTSSSTTLMQSYFTAVREKGLSFSPSTLRGFLTQRLVANIVERISSKLMQSTFLSTLYAVSVVVLDANAYSIGPLSNSACATSSSNGRTEEGVSAATSSSSASTAAATMCEMNVGARQVNVRSLASVTATEADSLADRSDIGQFSFSSGRIDYHPLPTESSQTTLIVVVVVVVGVFALLLFGVIVFVACFTGRSHSNAPKDSSKMFTLIFTDIQSSTSLWAEVPDDMAKAIDLHHALIRALIAKHSGYEVKTIGDAFMIAFKDADDAVKLAYDLQHNFFNCKEFPASIDHAYLAFDREKMMEANADGDFDMSNDDSPRGKSTAGGDEADSDGGAAMRTASHLNVVENGAPGGVYIRTASTLHLRNLTAYLSPDDYNRMWHGIRVRIGINTAFGDIKRDEVTHAYDYYGTVTNTSARVEAAAHGGQVLMTKGTFDALSTSVTVKLYDIIPEEDRALCTPSAGPSVACRMGAVELRGLGDRVELYQLECVPGREYPPLRLDRADDDLDDELKDGTDATVTTDPQLVINITSEMGTQRSVMNGYGLSGGGITPAQLSTAPNGVGGGGFMISTTAVSPNPSRSHSPNDLGLGATINNNNANATMNNNNNNTMPNIGITVSGSPNPITIDAPTGGNNNTNNGAFYGVNKPSNPPPLRLGGLLGVDTQSQGGASMLSFRGGKGPLNAGAMNDLHASQFMASIATLFSIIPSEKRGKEMKRLCDLWRIKVDEKKLMKANRSSSSRNNNAAAAAAGGMLGAAAGTPNNNKISDRMSHRPSENASSEPFAKLTGSLTGGDGLTALCLEALAKRLKNVAGKKLSAAVAISNAAAANGNGNNNGGAAANTNAARLGGGDPLGGIAASGGGGAMASGSNNGNNQLGGGGGSGYHGASALTPQAGYLRHGGGFVGRTESSTNPNLSRSGPGGISPRPSVRSSHSNDPSNSNNTNNNTNNGGGNNHNASSTTGGGILTGRGGNIKWQIGSGSDYYSAGGGGGGGGTNRRGSATTDATDDVIPYHRMDSSRSAPGGGGAGAAPSGIPKNSSSSYNSGAAGGGPTLVVVPPVVSPPPGGGGGIPMIRIGSMVDSTSPNGNGSVTAPIAGMKRVESHPDADDSTTLTGAATTVGSGGAPIVVVGSETAGARRIAGGGGLAADVDAEANASFRAGGAELTINVPA